MGRNAIIVHGKPSREKFDNPELLDPSDSIWIPRVKRELTLNGIFAVAPDMPEPYDPHYRLWKRELCRYDLSPRTILVGYSAGACLLLRFMSENRKERVHKIALIKPWLDPNAKYGDFGRFDIDPGLTERCLGGLTVFHALDDDDDQAHRSTEIIRQALPEARMIELPAVRLSGDTFPELVDELV